MVFIHGVALRDYLANAEFYRSLAEGVAASLEKDR
jgi:hypothetical protein